MYIIFIIVLLYCMLNFLLSLSYKIALEKFDKIEGFLDDDN